MAALVLGLLVSSAKGNYDTQNNASAKIAVLDRVLAQYGSESKPTREYLRQTVEHAVDRLWHTDRSLYGPLGFKSQGTEGFFRYRHFP